MDVIKEYYDGEYAERALERECERGSFRKLAGVWPEDFAGTTVLDVGSGPGAVTAELAARGLTVVAVDIMAESARRASLRGLIPAVADAHLLPFRDNSFDAVLALDVVEHLFNPQLFMSESRRVLKPGGFLIIDIPNHFNIIQRINMLLGRGIVHHTHRRTGTTTTPWTYPHIRFPSRADIGPFVRESGFVIDKFVDVQFGPWDFSPANIPFRSYRVRETLARAHPPLFAASFRLRLRPDAA